jgi:hypothetical protein
LVFFFRCVLCLRVCVCVCVWRIHISGRVDGGGDFSFPCCVGSFWQLRPFRCDDLRIPVCTPPSRPKQNGRRHVK